MPISRSAALIAVTASLSAARGARLKLMVTDGNCSWCAITNGAVVGSKRATADSGTCGAPLAATPVAPATPVVPGIVVLPGTPLVPGRLPGTYSFDSADGSSWYCGIASSTMRYWLDWA